MLGNELCDKDDAKSCYNVQSLQNYQSVAFQRTPHDCGYTNRFLCEVKYNYQSQILKGDYSSDYKYLLAFIRK